MFVLDADMPGYDLCLMAACNHSIHDYGTFGTWGSLLAGGDVITATGTSQEVDTEVNKNKLCSAHIGAFKYYVINFCEIFSHFHYFYSNPF